jgi:tetratricopeptide (TPR) repeat protein
MRRLWIAAVVVLAGGPALWADEPPYREFVQGLRDRHYADLALEYLQELAKKKDLPPDVVAILPLELARTRVAVAEDTADAAQRAVLYGQARDDFTRFLSGKPRADLAAEANFDLARLLRLQAHAQLTLALQQDNADQQKTQKAQARAQFDAAGRALQQAAQQVDAQLARYQDPKTAADMARRQSLRNARRQAEFEEGLTLFDTIQTLDADAKRGELAQKALDVFTKVAGKDERDAVAWKALAWAGRCQQEIDNPTQARATYNEILAATSPDAEGAKRLARYFRILLIEHDPALAKQDPLGEVVKAAERWLEMYRTDRDTPEGYGVRFALADALHRQAAKLRANSIGGRELYGRAEKIYSALERTPNDYSQQARLRGLDILIKQFQAESHGKIELLKNFKECFWRAKIEFAQAGGEQRDAAKKRPGDPKEARAQLKKLDAKLQKHYQDAITALNRGLDLADDTTEPADRTEARFLLACAYAYAGRPYEAAVAGEDLARSQPHSPRAPAAAAYALQAYGQVAGKEPGGEEQRQKLQGADHRRMRGLAQYMIAHWPNDPSSDVARHELAVLDMQQGKLAEAVRCLSQIRPTYSAYTFAQLDLSSALLKLAQNEKTEKPPAGQPSYKDRAIAALKKVPAPAPDADAVTAQYYFVARFRLCVLLLDREQYHEVQTVAEQTAKQFEAAHLSAKVRDELKATVDTLPWYARYGEAKVADQAGKYADVKRLTDAFIKHLKDDQFKVLKDPRLVLGLLGLNLHADIRQGDQQQAKAVLDVLRTKVAGELEGASNIVLTLLVDGLRKEIAALRERGKPAEEELQKIIANYSAFFDELLKQTPATLTPEMLRFLATGLSALEKHAEAADLLARFPRPAPSTNADEEKRQREDDEHKALYHTVRLLYARELRLAKKFDDAARVLKEVADSPIGKRSLETKKEQAALLEDRGAYVPAAQAWGKLMRDLKPKFSDNLYRGQYFECYYHFVFCYYKHALTMTNPDRKQASIQKAAQYIISVEEKFPNMGKDGLRQRYVDLLQQEAPLRQEYERAGGSLLKGATSNGPSGS